MRTDRYDVSEHAGETVSQVEEVVSRLERGLASMRKTLDRSRVLCTTLDAALARRPARSPQ